MNALIIILAVIVIVLIYTIYYIMTAPVTVANNVYLKENATAIDSKKISQPYSVNYTVGVWIYVDSFTNNIGNFITYGSPGGSTTNSNIFSLRFDNSSPTLYADIAGISTGATSGSTTSTSTSTSTSGSTKNTISITSNFPMQTWTYVAVSVSTYYADVYLNGKLVVSKKLQYPSTASSDTTNAPTFYFSQNKPDIHITGLSRWAKALDPQTVWSYYTKGNGNPSGNGTKYGAAFVLTKDTNNYSWTLF